MFAYLWDLFQIIIKDFIIKAFEVWIIVNLAIVVRQAFEVIKQEGDLEW